MLQHLRLARARGSLTAPNSRVQDMALELMLTLDHDALARRRLDQVKGLVVQQGGFIDGVKEQFPEYFEVDPFAEAKTEDGEYDIDLIDESQIEWGAPASPEEDEALSRWFAEHERGSLTAAEMDG